MPAVEVDGGRWKLQMTDYAFEPGVRSITKLL